jgi:hypothetical protein
MKDYHQHSTDVHALIIIRKKGGNKMEQKGAVVDVAVCLAKCVGSGRCKCVSGKLTVKAVDIGRITINLYK